MPSKNGINIEEKPWATPTQSGTPPSSAGPTAFIERHYTVAEIAALWNLSVDAVRKIFQTEPGVLALGDPETRHKRRYTTLRIPESMLERVHRRLSKL
jgi:hypothetical protein